MKKRDFVKGAWDELLPAKARVYGHNEDHIQVVDDVLQPGHWCMGVEGHTSQHSFFLDLINGAVQVGTGLPMHGQHVCIIVAEYGMLPSFATTTIS